MGLLRFIPIKLTIYLVLGILLGKIIDPGIPISMVFTLLSLSLLGYLFHKDRTTSSTRFGILTCMSALCIGAFSMSLSQPENFRSDYTHQISKGNHSWHLKIREVLKPSAYSDRYIASLQSLDHKNATGKILIIRPVDSMGRSLEVDDELMVYSDIANIAKPLNPYQFDFNQYMSGLGVNHQIRLGPNNHYVLSRSSPTLFGVAAVIRKKIVTTLKAANFGTEELGIIQALLLGQRHDISDDTYNDYKNAGAVHILAVSGLHIGIILLLLEFLLKPLERLPKGKTIKLVVIVLLLWGFAILAGLSASVVRAVTMFSFVAYALYLNRPSNTFNILALSMFFILLVFDANLLFQVGFQMSYAAVFAIIWIYPLLQKCWYPKNWLLRKSWQLLSVSVAAQLGVLPISLFYFHQFPGLFFITNLLVLPFLGLVLGLGILVIMLSLLNVLPPFLAQRYDHLIGSMNTVIGWVADQEAFVFKNISFDGPQLILSYLIIITMILVFSKATFNRTMSFLLAIIGFQLYLIMVSYQAKQVEILCLVHQTRNTAFLWQQGNDLTVLTPHPQKVEPIVNDYQMAKRIGNTTYLPMQNSFLVAEKKMLVVDSLCIYPAIQATTNYVLLTDSPRLNLERLIDSLKPNVIIADGSNYRSFVKRWAKTCLTKKLPFHYTGEQGAYYFINMD